MTESEIPFDHDLVYRRGYQDGWEAAEAAANRAWRGRQKVFHRGDWLDGPTAAEKKAERMAIIEEAHMAGLHGYSPATCPWCLSKTSPTRDAASQLQHKGNYGVSEEGASDALLRCCDADADGVHRPGCTGPEYVAVYGPAKP